MDHKSDNTKAKKDEKRADAELKVVETASIPVIEEKLSVGKKEVESGKVRISKKVEEEEELIDVSGQQEEVTVERVAVNEFIDSPPPAIRHEGDTTIISVLKEVTVVEKRLMLVEEVRISKRNVETQSQQKVKLRKEEVIVDRLKGDSINKKGS